MLPVKAVFIASYSAESLGSFAVYATVTSEILKKSNELWSSLTTFNVDTFVRVKLVVEEVWLSNVKSTYSATPEGIVIVVVTV